MSRTVTMMLALAALGIGCTGCMSRMISEGAGAATGASGKMVSSEMTPDLTKYKGLAIETISVAPGLQAPAEMPSLLQTSLANAGAKMGLQPEGTPSLKLSGQIAHYETAGTVDTAIGPLAEVIVRMKMIDAQSNKVIGQANLIGRSKATSSSSPKNLADGVGKALDKWLKEGGLKKAEEKNKE